MLTVHTSDPQTLDECVNALREIEDDVRDCVQTIKRKGKDLIIHRFRQGRIAHRAQEMKDSSYGESVVKNLASQAGMHRSTLQRALQFYRHPQFDQSEAALRQWMTEKEEKKGRLTWTYCRNWVRRRLDDKGEDDPEDRLQEEIESVERSVQNVEQRAEDLREEVSRLEEKGASQDVIDQAKGVIAQAEVVAADTRRTAGRLDVPQKKTLRFVSEDYLDHVRSFNCLVCGKAETDAHHVRAGAMDTKDHDLFTIPLCREHRGEWHSEGRITFCQKHQLHPWKSVAYLIGEFFTGINLSQS